MRQRILGFSSDEVDIVDHKGSIDEKHDVVGDEVDIGVLVVEGVAIDKYEGVVGIVDDKGEIGVGEKHDIVGGHGVDTGGEVGIGVLGVDVEVLGLATATFSVKLHMRRIPSTGCSTNEFIPPIPPP